MSRQKDIESSIAGAGNGVTCSEVQQHLLAAPQPASTPSNVHEHLARCQACRALRAQLCLLDNLTREQAPELPAGFELSLRRRLKEEAHRADEQARAGSMAKHTRWRRAVLTAAAIVLVTGGGLFIASRWSSQEATKATYYRLHLAIQTSKEYKDVLFDVGLPRGVRPLPGAGHILGVERLAWQSSLHQGLNEIDLPLVSENATGTVRVQLSAGGERWTGSVALEAKEQNTTAVREAPSSGLEVAWVVTRASAQAAEGVQ